MPANVIDIFSRQQVDPATRPAVVVHYVGPKGTIRLIAVSGGEVRETPTPVDGVLRPCPCSEDSVKPAHIGLEEAIKRIREGLRTRSGKAWSVTRGKGTAYCWITISAPPKRLVNGHLSPADQQELTNLLGKPIQGQGESVPASSDYRNEYVARAEGRKPIVEGKPYWD